MKFSYPQVVLQEVPGEISFAISISGCPIKCAGCHSQETWNPNFGDTLDINSLLDKYENYVTCVLFYGGEWHPAELKIALLNVRARGLKTCLYTGSNKPIKALLPYLDYIKIGRWVASYGGLSSPTTNQRFYKIVDGLLLDQTHLFQQE